ncbi:MAG: prepilin-type N-terminal cleavage/methylation domain-containing protein [Candidatus Aminicenantes bacterium]|nr:prepilin-type N-terminal cleavage/methylation domain-containing protein [Candidatus Aminicenantes bacterium]
MRQDNHKNSKRGITLIELLVALCILSLAGMLGIPMFKASVERWEVSGNVRTVTSALSTARYDAIKMNRSVKFCIENNRLLLKEKIGAVWVAFMSFEVDKDVSLSINALPVFTPIGSVAPLCSIYVWNEHYQYKITLSSAGRIKVIAIKPVVGAL